MVIDHKSYALSETEGDHTLIAADDFIQSDVIIGKTKIEVSSLFISHIKSLCFALLAFVLGCC